MRAANMQALTNDIKKRYPGTVVYGVGDEPHKLYTSDHNEDDTPGSRAAQSDADSVPEHRAIDAMLGTTFTKTEADALVAKMVGDPASRRRLYYVIWNRRIWSRSNNWNPAAYDGDNPHTGHVHFSGWAADDENASSWPIVFSATGSGPTPPRLHRPWPSYMKAGHYFGLMNGPPQSHGGYYPSQRPDVAAIQSRLNAMGFKAGTADGLFGPRTQSAVKDWQTKFWGKSYNLGRVWYEDWNRMFTY